MTDEEIRALLKPHHDGFKIAQVVIGLVVAAITVAGIFVAIGKNEAAVAKIDRIEDKQIQQQDDITSIRYESKGANAAAQRVELKVDEGMKDINAQLRQMRVRR